MTATAAIVQGYNFTGPTLPLHPSMNAGTLAILDPTNWVNPVDIEGSVPTLPNIAAKNAVTLAGSGAGADWTLDVYKPETLTVSRSTAGGIRHALRTDVAPADAYAAYRSPAELNAYLNSHRGSSIYAFVGMRTFRLPATGANGHQLGFGSFIKNPVSRFQAYTAFSGSTPIQRGYIGGTGTTTPDTTLVAGQVAGFSVASTDSTTAASALAMFSVQGLGSTPVGLGATFYLGVLEDLSVSGLTRGQAHARDLALLTQLTTSGGRYSADS